jgi:hypothetical protein
MLRLLMLTLVIVSQILHEFPVKTYGHGIDHCNQVRRFPLFAGESAADALLHATLRVPARHATRTFALEFVTLTSYLSKCWCNTIAASDTALAVYITVVL